MRGVLEDARLELRLRLLGPPLVLAFAYLLTSTGGGRMLARFCSGMWLHELGHAVTAWWCGFFAVPGPWRTVTGEQRSVVVGLLVTAGIVALGVWAHRERREPLVVVASLLLVLQGFLTLAVRPHTARMLITFGGDAGAMLFGALLMTTFYVRPGSRLHETWLRWGLLGLGALAFLDTFRPWWRSRRDLDEIPFGEIEGVGHSDPTRLVDDHGWGIRALVSRYVALGVVCLLGLAVAHVAGLLAARRRLREVE
jgi:hypothetical protein